ncbi:DUF6387 family protein [Actinobacillus genomosp. 2]|uniref:DUF6387 family protein n=1 Tax=Actinobacillus genomosp. 2 TaxID=230709 RepID=UPI0024422010|nr:DUF6387 family protein [Actinobacillus genomosp. 2]WGE32476.1 DUF6387 family protein [Actinobacillus genomosp. 2]
MKKTELFEYIPKESVVNFKWFNLEKYACLNAMNRTQWDRIVWVRKLTQMEIDEHQLISSDGTTRTEDQFISSVGGFILSNVEMLSIEQKFHNKETSIDEIITNFDFSLFSACYDEILLDKDNTRANFLKKLANLIKTSNDYKHLSFYDELDVPHNIPFADLDNVIVIDTMFSDEAILSAVKEKLKHIRQKESHHKETVSKRYSDSQISSLIENKVIPYIDLMQWQNVTGEKLTDREISDLLFPIDKQDKDKPKGIDTLRQTTKKKAYELLKGSIKFI